jgi:multicomponent Na+:H+ antiporter subunit G
MQGFNTFGFKAILGIIFVFLTSPVAAHAISRAAHRSGINLTKETVIDQYQEDHELKEEPHVSA